MLSFSGAYTGGAGGGAPPIEIFWGGAPPLEVRQWSGCVALAGQYNVIGCFFVKCAQKLFD